MSERDEDPEVVADLRLRAASERDTTRSRKPPDFVLPVFVAQWPCKVCRAPIDVTADAVERVAIFNRALRDRGEPLLVTSELMACVQCAINLQRDNARNRTRDAELLAKVIARLKQSRTPELEHELIRQLRKLGHPDVDGLVKHWQQQRASKPTRSEP